MYRLYVQRTGVVFNLRYSLKFDLKVIRWFALRISYSTKQDGRREKEHLT